MQIALIILSLFYGAGRQIIPIYYPYFNTNMLYSFLVENNLSSSIIFYPDPTKGRWALNDSIFIIKKPVLEAMSLKERDSLTYINLNFATPIIDTFNRLFIGGLSSGSGTSYGNSYIAGYAYNKNHTHISSLFFKTSNNTILNVSNFESRHISFTGKIAWNKRPDLVRLSTTYKKGKFGLGAFYMETDNTNYGIKGTYNEKNIHSSLYIPLVASRRPYFDLLLDLPFLHIYLKDDVAYSIQNDSTSEYKEAILSLTPDDFELNLWGYQGGPDTTYGALFLLGPNSPLGGGFHFSLKKPDTKTASIVLLSHYSLYSGEFQYSAILKIENMKYIDYSVEILLFKNLVIRKFKNKNGDFIGVFVRLIN